MPVIISKTEGIYALSNRNPHAFAPLPFRYFGLQRAYTFSSNSSRASQYSAAGSYPRSTLQRNVLELEEPRTYVSAP
jgi:hypothetical protein